MKETQALQQGKQPSKTSRVPPAWRGSETKKGAMIWQTTVDNLPRTASVAGGSETKKGELKENAGAMTRETNVKTLPQAVIVAGGETKRRKPTRNGKVAQPSPARGKCLAENA